jgi:hypothetical protein
MDSFHLYRGRKIDLLLSGLHMRHKDEVFSIMPTTLPQAGMLVLTGCFVGTYEPPHRCVSAIRSSGIKHSFDTQEFVAGQGGSI